MNKPLNRPLNSSSSRNSLSSTNKNIPKIKSNLLNPDLRNNPKILTQDKSKVLNNKGKVKAVRNNQILKTSSISNERKDNKNNFIYSNNKNIVNINHNSFKKENVNFQNKITKDIPRKQHFAKDDKFNLPDINKNKTKSTILSESSLDKVSFPPINDHKSRISSCSNLNIDKNIEKCDIYEPSTLGNNKKVIVTKTTDSISILNTNQNSSESLLVSNKNSIKIQNFRSSNDELKEKSSLLVNIYKTDHELPLKYSIITSFDVDKNVESCEKVENNKKVDISQNKDSHSMLKSCENTVESLKLSNKDPNRNINHQNSLSSNDEFKVPLKDNSSSLCNKSKIIDKSSSKFSIIENPYFTEDSTKSTFTHTVDNKEKIIPKKDTPQASYNSFSSLSKPCSLINMGLTCYLNSALQGISSCYKFVNHIIQLELKNKNLIKLRTFASLIGKLCKGSASSLEISTNAIFREWNKPGQQDSYELLAHSINQVYNELRSYKEEFGEIEHRNLEQWLKVSLPMRMLLQYELKCDCGNVSFSPLQSDLAFHLSMDMSKTDESVQILLDRFFNKDIVEDYECDNKKCKAKIAKRQASLYWPLPETICIHLQRTYWNGTRMVKVGNKVDFENFVIIKTPFYKVDQMLKDDNVIVDRKYSLRSVIVHQGQVSFGHYICYKLFGENWYYTSDSSIHKVPWSEVSACQAYVLFYEIIEC